MEYSGMYKTCVVIDIDDKCTVVVAEAYKYAKVSRFFTFLCNKNTKIVKSVIYPDSLTTQEKAIKRALKMRRLIMNKKVNYETNI